MNDCRATPRTDAFEVSPDGMWQDFARELERELNEASSDRAIEICIERNAKLKDENAKLKKICQLIHTLLEISDTQTTICQTKKTQE